MGFYKPNLNNPLNMMAQVDDVFNVGVGYVTLKILKPMVELNVLEKIAMYGIEDIDERVPDNIKNRRRIEAISRYAFTLRQIISDTIFVFESKRDLATKSILFDLEIRTKQLEALIPHTYRNAFNHLTNVKYQRIHEINFIKVLEALIDVKMRLAAPVNKAGLIFRQKPNDNINDIVDQFVRKG